MPNHEGTPPSLLRRYYSAKLRSTRVLRRLKAASPARLTAGEKKKLRLKVSREKSAVARPHERKFLGLRIVKGKEGPIIGNAPKSIVRFKKRVREITKRNRGINLTRMVAEMNRYTMGWVNYLRLAQAKELMQKLDSWIRRRLRCFIWKHWKKWGTRVRHLRGEEWAHCWPTR